MTTPGDPKGASAGARALESHTSRLTSTYLSYSPTMVYTIHRGVAPVHDVMQSNGVMSVCPFPRRSIRFMMQVGVGVLVPERGGPGHEGKRPGDEAKEAPVTKVRTLMEAVAC